MEFPLDVRNTYPEGFTGPGGSIVPGAIVFGMNSCGRRDPFVPRYIAVICRAAGKSRCIESCHVCTKPTRKSGSIANVFVVAPGVPTNPFARVNGFSFEFATSRLFDSGDCCAI